MNVEVSVGAQRWRVGLRTPHDLSIPLRFDAPQPSAFGLPPATAVAFEAPGFVGDVSRGGSVNCPTITFSPHGNGTHTECRGHILRTPVAVTDVPIEGLIPATLVTVAPRVTRVDGQDFPQAMLTLGRVRQALADAHPAFLKALVVRTLPNDSMKLRMSWSGTHPPYVHVDAMKYLVGSGVQHLLVDLPSVDPERDDGRLAAHRAFWDGEGGSARTITEMIYVDNAIPDGRYLLDIQLAPFALDAAPSRPLLFELEAMSP